MTGMGSGGRKAHVRHEATPLHHAARRRCGVAARGGGAAAGECRLLRGPFPTQEETEADARQIRSKVGHFIPLG
jgi:hypothetical protein